MLINKGRRIKYKTKISVEMIKKIIILGALLTAFTLAIGYTVADAKANVYGSIWTTGKINTPILISPLYPSGLVGYWKLDENNGSTASDSSGNGNTGNLINFEFNSADGWVAGMVNNSLKFDGNDDYINIGNNAILNNLPQQGTIELWVKKAENNREQSLINKESSYYFDFQSDNSLRAHLYSGGTSYNTYSKPITDFNWHYLTLVWNSSQPINNRVFIYIDGILDVTGNVGGNVDINTNNLYIGSYYLTSGRYFNGIIDDVKIYDLALSAAEINADYNSTSPSPTPTNTPTPTPTPTNTPTPTPTPTNTPTPTPTPTNTPTYYVSSSGSDNNPGTQNFPFKTIQKGISAAAYGDTVQVLPGTYYLTDKTGFISIDKSINVIGSGRSNTIIDGSQITNYDATNENLGLVKISADGVYFGGFTVQNGLTIDGSNGTKGMIITSNNNTIEKNLIQHTFQSGIALWGPWSGSTKVKNNTIRYNELYDISKGNKTICGSGIHVQEALSVVQADTFDIYYNYVHHAGYSQPGGNTMCGAEGIDIYQKSLNGNIHHNYINDSRSVGLYFDEAQNVEAYQNIAENTYGWNGPPARGTDIALATERGGTDSKLWLHDNIANNSDRGLWICLESTVTGVIKDDTIGNSNIFYNNGADIYVKSCGATMSNIQINNNYVSKIIIESAVSGAVALSGNDMNKTDIVNQFNISYEPLKTDILNNVNG